MNRPEEAIKALEEAFKKGFRRFAHLEHDDDMDSLRNLPEYKALIREYRDKPVEEIFEEPQITTESAESLISDFKGSRRYLTADGSIANGAIVRIKEVKVGDCTLKNIEASVIKNQKAPLLLGQSVLERFGSITIDNQNNRLIIKHY